MRRAKRERWTMEGRMRPAGRDGSRFLLLLLCRGYELCNQAFSPDRETRIPTFAKYIYGMKYGEGGSRSEIYRVSKLERQTLRSCPSPLPSPFTPLLKPNFPISSPFLSRATRARERRAIRKIFDSPSIRIFRVRYSKI